MIVRCIVAGHGSHVAGIVGAKGFVVGQAPDVTLGMPCPPGDRRYYVYLHLPLFHRR